MRIKIVDGTEGLTLKEESQDEVNDGLILDLNRTADVAVALTLIAYGQTTPQAQEIVLKQASL